LGSKISGKTINSINEQRNTKIINKKANTHFLFFDSFGYKKEEQKMIIVAKKRNTSNSLSILSGPVGLRKEKLTKINPKPIQRQTLKKIKLFFLK